jgi:hypothetical protein
MKNLKSLELDSDPNWIHGDYGIELQPYPLHQIEAIKSLEKLKLIHSIQSKSIQAYGHIMLGLLPQMPNLKIFEN